MLAKTVFVFAFAALAQFAAAAPPACLLGAVTQYKSPADISAVCKAKDATSKIAKICGDATEDALSAFADICNEAGVKVSTDVPTTATGSIKPSGTGNSTASATGSGATTLATAAPTGSGSSPSGGSGAAASGTATGGPAQSTGAAGKLEVGAAALLAGLMAVAL